MSLFQEKTSRHAHAKTYDREQSELGPIYWKKCFSLEVRQRFSAGWDWGLSYEEDNHKFYLKWNSASKKCNDKNPFWSMTLRWRHSYYFIGNSKPDHKILNIKRTRFWISMFMIWNVLFYSWATWQYQEGIKKLSAFLLPHRVVDTLCKIKWIPFYLDSVSVKLYCRPRR